jgi:hypothetical protein
MLTLGLIFWILMLLWLVFGIATRMGSVPEQYGVWGNQVFLFILFLLIGWRVFGAALN